MSTEVNSKNIFETENGQVERASKELEAAFLTFEQQKKNGKKKKKR